MGEGPAKETTLLGRSLSDKDSHSPELLSHVADENSNWAARPDGPRPSSGPPAKMFRDHSASCNFKQVKNAKKVCPPKKKRQEKIGQCFFAHLCGHNNSPRQLLAQGPQAPGQSPWAPARQLHLKVRAGKAEKCCFCYFLVFINVYLGYRHCIWVYMYI